MAKEEVIVEIGAEDNASRKLEKVGDEVTSLGDKAEAGSGKAESGFSRFRSTLKTMTPAVLAAGAAVGGFLVLAVNAARGAQEQMARVDATLLSMGAAGLKAKDQILEMAAATVKLGFDDEDAAESLSKLFQRTNDLSKAQELLALSIDLARAKNIELGAASDLVGQVLSGNGKALKQYGIDIKDAATPMEALAELQGKVAGQAEAYSETFNGQIDRLNQTWTNFLEEVGTPLIGLLTEAINKFLNWTDSIGGTAAIIENFKLVVSTVAPIFKVMWAALSVVFAAIGAAIEYTYLAWLKTSRFFSDSSIVVSKAWSDMMEGMRAVTSAVWEGIKATFVAGINWLIDKMNDFIRAIQPIAGTIGKAIGVKRLSFGEIPRLASGGIVTSPTLAMIGEAGAEAVIPLNSARGRSMGAGGGITVVVEGNNFYGDDEQFAQKIGDQIMRMLEPHLQFAAS